MAQYNYLNNNVVGDSHTIYDNFEFDSIMNTQLMEGSSNDLYFSNRNGLSIDPLEDARLFAEKLYEKNNLLLKDINFYENFQNNYTLQGCSEKRNNHQITPAINEGAQYEKPYNFESQVVPPGNTQKHTSVQIESWEGEQQRYNPDTIYGWNATSKTNMKDNLREGQVSNTGSYVSNSGSDLDVYDLSRRNEFIVAKSPNFYNPNYLEYWNLNLKVVESSVSCLTIGINYNGYSGTIEKIFENHPYLENKYAKAHDEMQQRAMAISLYQEKERLSSVLGVKQRIKFIRRIDNLHGTVKNIIYKTSAVFSMDNPYEPQYYRFEVDSIGKLKNETKCGMCPYCEEVKFLPFKNSSYLSHLTLEHGIFSNNYITPNGLYYGSYTITKREKGKNAKILKSRKVDGIQCPHCFAVIEVGCWSMKTNKLLSYFRHFKNAHGDELEILKFDALQAPQINVRGRRLKVIN